MLDLSSVEVTLVGGGSLCVAEARQKLVGKMIWKDVGSWYFPSVDDCKKRACLLFGGEGTLGPITISVPKNPDFWRYKWQGQTYNC